MNEEEEERKEGGRGEERRAIDLASLQRERGKVGGGALLDWGQPNGVLTCTDKIAVCEREEFS